MNIQYNTISLSSPGENYSQIFALFNSAIVDENWYVEYDVKHYSLENKLIRLNKSFIQKYEKGENWNNDYILREEEILYFYNDLEQELHVSQNIIWQRGTKNCKSIQSSLPIHSCL